jgi:hypothetical protein
VPPRVPPFIADYPSGTRIASGKNLFLLAEDKSQHVPAIADSDSLAIEGIVVPAYRSIKETRRSLLRIMELAQQFGLPVVFLCSGHIQKSDIADCGKPFKNLEWAAIEGPFDTNMLGIELQTSQAGLAYGTRRDAGIKRNLALKLARLMSWKTVLFLDDDIEITERQLLRLADIIASDDTAIAGFNARSFADHSVVCAAYKLGGGAIDAFVSSQMLAVKVDQPVTAFFPHIYNEDWLFMLPYVLSGEKLVWAGEVHQSQYDPFRSPDRASCEEAGDLLAEGLFRLCMKIGVPHDAPVDPYLHLRSLLQQSGEGYWRTEISRRRAFIADTRQRIRNDGSKWMPRKRAILRSLDASLQQLDGKATSISPHSLKEWVALWVRDIQSWSSYLASLEPCRSLPEALEYAGLDGLYHQGLRTRKSGKRPSQKQSRHKYHKPTQRDIGVANTASLERFIGGDIKQCFLKVVESYDHIRFDWPSESSVLYGKPAATINLFIQEGESAEAVAANVATIDSWNKNDLPIDCILWVLQNNSDDSTSVYAYRDYLVSLVTGQTFRTGIRIRSAVVNPRYHGMDQLIARVLGYLMPADWKSEIVADKQLIFANSRLDVLRYGYFADFFNHESTYSSVSLRYLVMNLTSKDVRPSVVPFSGIINYVSADKGTSILRPTHKLVRLMRRTRLSWPAIDSMCYDLITHHPLGDEALRYVKTMAYFTAAPAMSPRQILAQIHATAQRYDYQSGELAVVVLLPSSDIRKRSTSSIRQELERLLTHDKIAQQIVVETYPLQTETVRTKSSRRRLYAMLRYMFWLENHGAEVRIVCHDQVAVSWRQWLYLH